MTDENLITEHPKDHLRVDRGDQEQTKTRGGELVTPTLAPNAPLTAIDRCDRCGAQAYVRVSLLSGGELLFCAHHFTEYGPALKAASAHVHDETSRLGEIAAIATLDER
jgi:hypothetical protein